MPTLSTLAPMRLRKIRETIAGRVADAEGSTLPETVVDHFVLHIHEDGRTEVEPVLRAEAVAADLLRPPRCRPRPSGPRSGCAAATSSHG